MGDTETKALINKIINASRIEGEDDGVYFLGPFAKRVNFSAQQNRALNLVYALRAGGLLPKDKPIAVVGAGLAGLTITAALIALKYEVELFERRRVILARQRNTGHRLIHPTINAWPDHPSLDPTTQLPFFDWCTDNCKRVMSAISKEWRPFADQLKSQNRLHMKTKVLNYHARKTGITLETRPTQDGKVFQAVIFATGFEDEKSIPNAARGSYWKEDNYEDIRDGDAEDPSFVVSGTGDGGLIDSLRLAHTDFDGGELVVRVATALFGTDTGREIRDAEAEYNSHRSEQAERKLELAYEQAALHLPHEVLADLDASLIKITPLVWLVSRNNTAYARDAAPIHKLLIAHAINEGTVKYVRKGTVSVAKKNRKIVVEPAAEAPSMSPDALVVRHGADNALIKLLKKKGPQLAKLISAQRDLSDDLILPFWMAGEMSATLGYPANDPKTKEFHEDRFERAKSIERLWPHMRLTKGVGEFIIESKKDAGWRPTRLFGVPVRWNPVYPDISGRL